MKVGMLWLDASRERTLAQKVERAVAHYVEKYGRQPNLCLVNRQTADEATHVAQVDVVPAASILPHHFWLGVAE